MLAIALDASQIVQFLTCEHAWYLRYRENLEKVGIVKESLDKGSMFHAFLESYYNLQADNPMLTYAERAKITLDNYRVATATPFYEALSNRFLQYCLRWHLSDFMPLKNIERSAAVEVGFSKIIYKDKEYTFIIEGRIDLLAKIEDVTIFVDHKTQGRMSNLYQYKTQFLTYALATGLDRGLINYIGLTKETNDNTFRRQLISFPAWKVEQWKHFIINNVFFPVAKKLKNYQHVHENVLDVQILDYVNSCERELFERKLNACSGAFDSNPCMYTALCETKDPQLVKNIKAFNYFKAEPWSPWREEE